MSQQVSAWCFTINNPVEQCVFTEEQVKYAVWQLEAGENGTPHYQGYVEFKRSKRLTAAKSLIGQNAHVEPRRGTREQARDYCKKEEGRLDGPWEFGDFGKGGQGKRSDLIEVVEAIKLGKRESELASAFPIQYIKYSTGIKRLKVALQPPRDWKTNVIIHYGKPGSGKTFTAANRFPGAFWKMANVEWWEGYDAHSDVILDDHNTPWMPWATLMQVMDQHQCLVNVKGSSAQFLARNLVITTNVHPCDWYLNAKEKNEHAYPNDALIRRINEWWVFSKSFDINGEPVYNKKQCSSYEEFCSLVD